MQVPHPIHPEPIANSRPPTVLIIDDDYDVRTLIARVVRRTGAVALEAGDGRSGLELFQHNQGAIGCVILDLYMPIFAGPLTFRALREADRAIPIVLISGNPDDLARLTLHDELTIPLSKPFTVIELRDTLQRLLGTNTVSAAR